MKELQKMVEQLRDITNHYATLINSGTPFSVAYSDEKKICTLLDKLIVQVKPYSDNLSTNLTDVRNNLFIHNTNGFIAINSFRFGSLRTIISYLRSTDFICNFARYINTPWDDINQSMEKILKDASCAKDRLDFNQVGVTCRETYILLAKKVYNPDIHKEFSAKNVSDTDAKGMLGAYLTYHSQNDKLKKYVQEAVALAETVTHMKMEDYQRMNSLVIAIVSLVGIVNNIEEGGKRKI